MLGLSKATTAIQALNFVNKLKMKHIFKIFYKGIRYSTDKNITKDTHPVCPHKYQMRQIFTIHLSKVWRIQEPTELNGKIIEDNFSILSKINIKLVLLFVKEI